MSWLDDVQTVQQLNTVNDFSKDSQLNALNSRLYDIYSNLSNLDGVQTNALSRQNDVDNIMTEENYRLQDKAAQIDKAVANQKRIIYFNDNSRKIHAAYLKIVITLAFTLAIVWIIRVISHHFGSYIHVIFINIAMIVSVSIGLIIIYNYYRVILRHNKYNYDELNFDPPTMTVAPNTDATAGSNLLSGSNIQQACTGSYCCNPPLPGTPGTVWDQSSGKCIFAAALPTTTKTAKKQGFSTMSSEVSEFENYSPYK